MLVHDSFSSIGVTLALLRHITFGAWTYVGRSGSMAEYRHRLGVVPQEAYLSPGTVRDVKVVRALDERWGA